MGRSERGTVLGPLESEIMRVLWGAEDAMSVRTVLGELNRHRDAPLAYTTVMTVLARLADRGVAQRTSAGRRYAYQAAAGSTAEIAVRQVLNEHGEAALASFVDQVSNDEQLRSRLRKLMDEP